MSRPPLVGDLLVTPEPPLPVLTRIIATPVLTPDGGLHDQPGYDPRSRSYYVPTEGFVLPPVSEAPTAAEVKWARWLIIEPIKEFPWVSPADKANAVGLLMTVFVRALIDGPTPLHLLFKPKAGTGSTLCAEAMVLLATGQDPNANGQGEDDAEWKKKLTAILLEAPDIVLFDNLEGQLKAPSLMRALTGRVWEERLLGVNKLVHLPIGCVWVGTANNLALDTQTVRRFVPIKMDSETERPWLRAREGRGHLHPRGPARLGAHGTATVGPRGLDAVSRLGCGREAAGHGHAREV